MRARGHDVTLICREPNPRQFPFVSRATGYTTEGEPSLIFRREVEGPGSVVLHQLPEISVFPVFVKDKQREGNVKSFPEMTEAELQEYHAAMAAVVERALVDDRCEMLHVNHLVYQGPVAFDACRRAGVPYYIVPHGSSIEYTIKQDDRFLEAGRRAIEGATGLVWIAGEVRDRVLDLYPDLRAEILRKSVRSGVGTDTRLFRPLPPEARIEALEELAAMHRRGGRTADHRQALRDALDRGELDSIRATRGDYDQKLADDDLPEILGSIPRNAELLLYVGALTYGKGVQSLIAALPEIVGECPDAHLAIVGSGNFREALEGLVHALDSGNEELFDRIVNAGRELETGEEQGALEDLRAYAADAANRKKLLALSGKLARHVHFLGRLDHPRLRWFFPCCRLALFPSVIKEASPLVFYESMANGVLPAGSYHSGLRDGLDDLRPELPQKIWEKMKLPEAAGERVRGIADSVVALLREPGVCNLRERLREIAEERHDWHTVAAELSHFAGFWAGRVSSGHRISA